MDLSGVVIFILICIVLFFVFRAVVLWYWKIDRIVKLLEDIKDSLHKDTYDQINKASEPNTTSGDDTKKAENSVLGKISKVLKTEIKLK